MTKDASLTVRLEPDLKATYEVQAAALNMKMSALVVRTLRRAAKRWQANAATGVQPGSGTPSERVSLNGKSESSTGGKRDA